jgi:hypothetical protein
MATVHRLWPRFGWSSHRHERQIWSVRLSQMSWPLTLTQTCHDEVQLLNTDYIIFTYICLLSIYNVNFISVIIWIYIIIETCVECVNCGGWLRAKVIEVPKDMFSWECRASGFPLFVESPIVCWQNPMFFCWLDLGSGWFTMGFLVHSSMQNKAQGK